MSSAASARNRKNVTLSPSWFLNVGHPTQQLISAPRTLDSTFKTFGEGLPTDDERRCLVRAEEQIAICVAGRHAQHLFGCSTHEFVAAQDFARVVDIIELAGLSEPEGEKLRRAGGVVGRRSVERSQGGCPSLGVRTPREGSSGPARRNVERIDHVRAVDRHEADATGVKPRGSN